MPPRDTAILTALLAALALAAAASLVAPATPDEPQLAADAASPPATLQATDAPADAPSWRHAIDAHPPQSIVVCGSAAWLDLLRRALDASDEPISWQNLGDQPALALARAHPHVLALTTTKQPLTELAARPVLSRAIAVVGPPAEKYDVTWARLRSLARHADGGLPTTVSTTTLLACGNHGGLPLAPPIDTRRLERALAHGQFALVDLPLARALGRTPYAIDGVAPSRSTVHAGHYPLGITLRLAHRFDVEPRARRVADRLLGIAVETNLKALWPE